MHAERHSQSLESQAPDKLKEAIFEQTAICEWASLNDEREKLWGFESASFRNFLISHLTFRPGSPSHSNLGNFFACVSRPAFTR